LRHQSIHIRLSISCGLGAEAAVPTSLLIYRIIAIQTGGSGSARCGCWKRRANLTAAEAT
ncbi:MAG: hypothetical protein ACYC64_16370, partial [Armatimonadota bacterium]